MTQNNNDAFDAWAIVELMGHRKLAGRVSEEQHFGVTMLRIDIPKKDGMVTQFYGGSAVYCITPTAEKLARAFAARTQPKPVYSYELADLALPDGVGDETAGEEPQLTGNDLPF